MSDKPYASGLTADEQQAVEQWLAGQKIANHRDLLNGLLDGGYDQAVAPVIQAVLGNGTTGVIAQRLKELEEEAKRLEAQGLRLTLDNPVFNALMNDYSRILAQNTRLLQGAAPMTLENALTASKIITREMALTSDDFSIRYNVRWNVPNPDAVAAVVDYTTRPAFQEAFDLYEQSAWSVAMNQAIRGVVEGWSPLRTAREIRRMVEDYTASEANNLMRTLQLTGYRDAAVVHQVANADIIETIIRVGILDARICLCCIALHGTELAVGERVDDHHQGRCIPITVLKGFPRTIQTGVDWFNNLPDETDTINKHALMGDANYEAWKAGKVQLKDFVQPYTDPLFGSMLREASLKGILGDAAKDYYKRN